MGLNHPYDVPAVELSDGKIAPYDKAQWLLDAAAHQAYTRERMKGKNGRSIVCIGSSGRPWFQCRQPLCRNFRSGLYSGSWAFPGRNCRLRRPAKRIPRFKACLNFDGLQLGGPFSMEETAIPPSQPFLFLTKESQLHPRLSIQSFESTSESYWVVLHGASHDSFTDGPVLQPTFLPIPNRADQTMSLIQRYTLAFLDQTLKGQPSNLLSENAEGGNISVRVSSFQLISRNFPLQRVVRLLKLC